jgi:Zn-dependent protease with chaperone function
MRPNASFNLLLGVALAGALLLAAAVIRFLRAGIPAEGRSERAITWHGVLVPGSGDLYIHLVSYLLLAVLFGGSLRAIWRAAWQLHRTRRFVTSLPAAPGWCAAALARAGSHAGLAGRVDVLIDTRPLAFCYGLRRPRVAVSTGLLAILDEAELEAVLRHEAYHVANRDPLRLVAAGFLATAFFFLPLLAMLRDHFAVAKELAADQEAICKMGMDRSLAAALYKLLLLPEQPMPVAAVGARSAIALRVEALLAGEVRLRPQLRPGALLWTLGGGAVLLLLLVMPLSLLAGDCLLVHHPTTHILC